MRTQRVPALGGLLTAPLLLTPALLSAQPLTLQPTGYEYPTSYSTSATFSCSGRRFPGDGACSSSSNSLTISGGGGSFTVSFIGAAGSVVAKTSESQRVSLGSFVTSVSGPFIVPEVINRFDPLFFINIVGLSGGNRLGFFGRYISPTELALQSSGDYTLTFLPDALRLVWHSQRLDRPNGLTNDTIGVSADVGIVPEPSTWALLGTGLLGLAGVARRRRRTA